MATPIHEEKGKGRLVKTLLAVVCCPVVLPLLLVALVLICVLTPVYRVFYACCGKRDRVDKGAITQTHDDLVDYAKRPQPYCTTNGTDAITPFASSKGMASFPPSTLVVLMREAGEKGRNHPALAVERPLPPINHTTRKAAPALPLSEWTTWSWEQYAKESMQVARSLMHVGVKQHDAVAIYGFNAPEW